MIVFPNAKINLGLTIIEKRSDGYHNLETIFYPVKGLFDALEIIEQDDFGKFEMSFSGNKIPGDSDNNICKKAYDLISKNYPLKSIKVHLHKHIPIGAGLGGGSSDGAFFIKLLNEKLKLNLSFGELHHYAKQLGSDCSFFINNKPSFAIGKGDQMELINIDLGGKFLFLVFPNVFVSTVEAYSGISPSQKSKDLESKIHLPLQDWKYIIINDFETSIFKKFPLLETIKKEIYSQGAIYSAMSGSGGAMFGVFETMPLNFFEKEKYFVSITEL
jgi:4-diphosphocytidyl-2-C-methyl-D-erythritol kinase